MEMKMNILVVSFLLIGLKIVTCENLDKDVVEDAQDGLAMLGNLLGMMNSGVDDSKCKFQCPSGSKPKKNPAHVPSSNGCGSFGFKLDTDIPGFESCCDEHDKCYDTCNSNREKCDEKFRKCLESKCDKGMNQRNKDCNNMAFVMYSGAKSMGCMAYKNAQHEACLCDGKKVPIKKGAKKNTTEKVDIKMEDEEDLKEKTEKETTTEDDSAKKDGAEDVKEKNESKTKAKNKKASQEKKKSDKKPSKTEL